METTAAAVKATAGAGGRALTSIASSVSDMFESLSPRRPSLESRASKVFTELKETVPEIKPVTPYSQAMGLLKDLKLMLANNGDVAMRDRLARAMSLLTVAQRNTSHTSGEDTPIRLRDAAIKAMLVGARSGEAVGVRAWMPETDEEEEDLPLPPTPKKLLSMAREAPLCERVMHPSVVTKGFEGELLKMLERSVYDWQFDSIRLTTLTGGHPLLALCWALCEHHSLREKLGFKTEQVLSFFASLESQYQQVPYHNVEHATDVTHAFHWLITTDALSPCALEPLDIFICIVAAAGHDANHDGRNNAWHNKIHSEHALTHAYQAPLERHHLAVTFRELETSGLLNVLTEHQRHRVRERLVALILATDFGVHKTTLDDFANMIAAMQSDASDKGEDVTIGSTITPEERLLCLKMAIKLSDLSYLSKGTAYAAIWTDRVLEEFFAQGDAEQGKGFPITPGFNRETHAEGLGRINSQLGFVGFMVMPLFNALKQLVPEVVTPAVELQALYDTYKSQQAELEAEGKPAE